MLCSDDISEHFTLSVQQRVTLLEKMYLQISSCNFKVYFVPFAMYVQNPRVIRDLIKEEYGIVNINEGDEESLNDAIDQNANLTNKIEILQIIE